MLTEEVARLGYERSILDISVGSGREGYGKWRWARAIEYVRLFIRYLTLVARRPSVVYVTIAQSTVGFVRDFLFIWFGWLFRVPVVVHLKGGNYGGFYKSSGTLLRAVIRSTLRRSSAIVVLSDCFRGDFSFVENDSLVRVVANGLTDQRIAEIGEEKTRSLESRDELRLLFLSNLIASKGYRELLKAAKQVAASGVPIEVRFCGEFMGSHDDPPGFDLDAARSEFETEINALDSRKFKLCGVVQGGDKVAALAWADVFVLPTRYVNEGQPVSVIEAMAAACALITTKFRAIEDMVEEGVNGMYVNATDSESIAQAILALASDRKLVALMQKDSARRFQGQYTQQVHLKKLIGELDRVSR